MEQVERSITRSMTGATMHLIPPAHENFNSLLKNLKDNTESDAGAGDVDSSEIRVEVEIGQMYDVSGSSSGSGNSSIFPGGYNDGGKKKRR